MIQLSQQLCDVLDLTYWQQQSGTTDQIFEVKHTIDREEKELVRKILLAKGIQLKDEMIEVRDDNVIIIHLQSHTLIFDDVNQDDKGTVIYLSKIKSMMQDQQQKKLTWYKLKNIDL